MYPLGRRNGACQRVFRAYRGRSKSACVGLFEARSQAARCGPIESRAPSTSQSTCWLVDHKCQNDDIACVRYLATPALGERRHRSLARRTAADKRLSPGDVIVEIGAEAVANADDLQAKIDKLRKDGRKSALLLLSDANGELRFQALNLW